MSLQPIRKTPRGSTRIDDLRDLTAVTRGKLTVDLRPLDLHVALREAIATTLSELQSKQQQLRLELVAPRTLVSADPVRLQQVFGNVVKNAVKFTPPCGLIAVKTRVLEDGHTIAITVTDSGVGMTPEELARVFEAFSQGDHAHPRSIHRFGGLGLSLAISHALIGLHRGRIAASSAGRNRGATLTIELPLLPPPAALPKAAAASSPPMNSRPYSNARILLVEDHEPTRLTLDRLLTRRGYRVTCAGTVADAHALAEREEFDVLISDLGLPDGNGCELMSAVHERFSLKGIALSGYGMEHDLLRSREVGFTAHLVKPVTMQSLDAALLEVLAVPAE